MPKPLDDEITQVSGATSDTGEAAATEPSPAGARRPICGPGMAVGRLPAIEAADA